jgi:hypothetical protein
MSQPYTVPPFQLHRNATIIQNQPRQNYYSDQDAFKVQLNEPPPNYDQLVHQRIGTQNDNNDILVFSPSTEQAN